MKKTSMYKLTLTQDYKMHHDPGDPWGSCLGYHFEICHELSRRGAHIPDEWQYRDGAMGPPEDEGCYPEIADASDEDLVALGNILSRYADKLRLAGRDY